MSTAANQVTIYTITPTSAVVQWFVNGSDTNYSDILCVGSDGKTVWSTNNIHTPNSQFYSDTMAGLLPGKTYHGYIRTKLDLAGNGDSGWILFSNFTTLSAAQGIKDTIYVNTNIGGYFFDVYLQLTHTSSLTITSDPVETGAAITDHSYISPAELIILVGMSDVAHGISQDQFTQGPSRSVMAFQILKDLQRQRIPLQVVTKLAIYKNMLIETISAPDDNTTREALKATVTFKEIFVVSTQTVKVSARPQTTDSTSKGDVQVIPVDPGSILFQANGDKSLIPA